MLLEDVTLRDTRANQPAANAVAVGTLYCVTDEDFIVERSDGASWEEYSPAVGVTTTGSPANGNLAKFTAAGTISNADLTGAVTTSGGVATTLATGLNPDFASVSIASQKWQTFVVQITNNGGTLQHLIRGYMGGSVVAAGYADKITGASSSFQNTPTVGAGTDFTTGVGITSNIIVLNTAEQTTTTMACEAYVVYYDGNVILPYCFATLTSRDVNGTTRVRLEINVLQQDLTTGAWTINTTNLPTNATIGIRVSGYLA